MGTWRIVGTSWKTVLSGLVVVGVVAAVQVVLGLLALPVAGQFQAAPEAPEPLVLLLGLVLALVNFFVYPLLQGGYLSFAKASLAPTSSSPLASFWRGATTWYARLLGLTALMVLIVLGFSLVSILLFVVPFTLIDTMMAAAVVLTLIVAAPVAIGLLALMLITAMAPLAVVVDGVGVFGAIKQGLAVGRRALGKLVVVTLAMALTLLPAVVLVAVPAGLDWQLVATIVQSLVAGLSAVLYAVAYVHVYQLRAAPPAPAPSGFAPLPTRA